ncbi:MAG TPA: hypothetical protein VGH79_00420 [Gaiellaceae bacterium]
MSERPRVVCLCGSSRFREEFDEAAATETLAGRIVLSLGIFSGASGATLSDEQVALLRRLHLQRIDLADEILVINPGGYVGETTAQEIEYARSRDKTIRWLFSSSRQRS